MTRKSSVSYIKSFLIDTLNNIKFTHIKNIIQSLLVYLQNYAATIII